MSSKVRILACPPHQAGATWNHKDSASSAKPNAYRVMVRSWFNPGGRSSVVESQPSKLAVVGSIPTARSNPSSLDRSGGDGRDVRRCSAVRAHVAQLVEHVLGKDEVTGSSPVLGSS